MSIWTRIFSRKEEPEQELVELELSLNELTHQVTQSIKQVNDLEDNYADPVIERVMSVKESLNYLMSKELNHTFNKVLLKQAELTRENIIEKANPFLKLSKPSSLQGLNQLINQLNQLVIALSQAVTEQNAEIIFKKEVQSIKGSVVMLDEEVDNLVNAISERNNQLKSFKKLLTEVDNLKQELQNLEALDQEELNHRRHISSNEKDKSFLTSEIKRIKGLTLYEDLRRAKTSISNLETRKEKLKELATREVNKFSKILRAKFKNQEFVLKLLKDPIEYFKANRREFHNKMNDLFQKLNNKEKEQYGEVIKANELKNYFKEYTEISEMLKELNKKDFTTLNKSKVFERRLLELTKESKSLLKDLDSFAERKNHQLNEIKALKAKVEGLASECYLEKIKIQL